MTIRARLAPAIVSAPLFLQNLDTTVMGTALPSIAVSLAADPLQLNLAITSYLLSLAIFLPASGWLAERYGARRIFCVAIAFFAAGSALCGAAHSVGELVFFRILQGAGGAMMVPVSRLILLRSVPAAQMVAAMVWFTVLPAVGRLAGPLFGGAIVTVTSWRWIFLVNIPFGVLGVALALRFIDELPASTDPEPFDARGFVLLAAGLALLLGALEVTGSGLAPFWTGAVGGLAGTVFLAWYWHRSRGASSPLVDLGVLRFRTFRTAVIGGLPMRIGLGATPFLLPLLLQLGFGVSAMTSGLLTVATAFGSLATRPVLAWAIRRFGFRRLILGATTLSGLIYMAYSRFTPATPHELIFMTLLCGGLVNSLAFVTLATLGFSELPPGRMSHATTLSTMTQQLTVSFGVVLAAALVGTSAWWHGRASSNLLASDFAPAFLVIGCLALLSLIPFAHLKNEDGADMREGAAAP